ncbi:MAG: hypothetical protein O2968_05245 [Acidobacteria bacterium]|nr:hypothetical protein [Acidobacteriota bacterium]
MPGHEDDTNRAARRLLIASKVQLASALILNSTAAMNAENAIQQHRGSEPRFTAESFWSDVESVYDQLDLPHQHGIILPWKLFDV